MNNEGHSTWPAAVTNTEDDFANFLDFPELEIDFSNLDANVVGVKNIQDDQGPLKNHHYSHTGYYAGDGGMREDALLPKSASATDMNTLKGRISGLQMQSGSLPSAEQHGYLGQHALQFQSQGRIPPTPTSLDIHGNRHHYSFADPQQQMLFEAQMQKQSQDQVSLFYLISGSLLMR